MKRKRGEWIPIGEVFSIFAVWIPKSIAELWGVHEGSAIEIAPRGKQGVMRKRACNLADMLSQVTTDNLHPEISAGPALGNEK